MTHLTPAEYAKRVLSGTCIPTLRRGDTAKKPSVAAQPSKAKKKSRKSKK